MKRIIVLILLLALLTSCNSNEKIGEEIESIDSKINSGIIEESVENMSGTENSIDTKNNINRKTNISKDEIFKKLQDEVEKVKENNSGVEQKVKSTSNKILVQGNIKAEYIGNNGDYSKSDTIKITEDGKSWNIPGVYKATKENIKCAKKYPDGLGGNCAIGEMENLIGFSPSGYYLLYSINLYEGNPYKIVNIKTGKEILEGYNIGFNSWTKDKKQFVYAEVGRMGPQDTALYITKKGNFPNTIKLLDGEVLAGYIDDKNIYVLVSIFDEKETKYEVYKKVIDIETLKITYSEKI